MRSLPTLQHMIHGLRNRDPGYAIKALFDRIVPARASMRPAVLTALDNGVGLEIGGPSQVFTPAGILPVYPIARHVDNVNFESETAWESGLQDGAAFTPAGSRKPGRQFLCEAGALAGITDGSYDFVVSSHCLEHLANPLAALAEWRRVTASKGHLLVLVPDPTRIFDRRRPITTIEHLREDLRRGTCEDDLTHLDEVLALHDIGRDLHANSAAEFAARTRLNAKHRCMHHHVFNLDLLAACLSESGWDVIVTERIRPVHLAALARNPGV